MKKITGNISPVGKIGGNVTPTSTIEGVVSSVEKIEGTVTPLNTIRGNVTYGIGGNRGVSDYELLENLPSIEGVTLIGDKTLSDLGIDNSVNDVQINNESIVVDGVAEIPIASGNILGTVMVANGSHGLTLNNYGRLMISGATSESIKSGASIYNPITVSKQHEATFYGLAKASGDVTQSASNNAVGIYTDDAKSSIQSMLGVPSENDVVTNVQINGTSIINNGIANIPIADNLNYGAVKVVSSYGVKISNGFLGINQCSASMIQNPSSASTSSQRPITPDLEDKATFYGLAMAAGDTTQSQSDNPVGTYTDNAKTAIRTMLGIDTASILQEVENGLPSAEGVSF